MSPVDRKNPPRSIAIAGSNLSPKIADQLEALPCFQGLSTAYLCKQAQAKMRSKRPIECRLTAMLIIVGNTPLTDEVFQIPPTVREREIGG